jgi:hypothetical protein
VHQLLGRVGAVDGDFGVGGGFVGWAGCDADEVFFCHVFFYLLSLSLSLDEVGNKMGRRVFVGWAPFLEGFFWGE